MADHKGLDRIVSEVTIMANEAKGSIHKHHMLPMIRYRGQ